MGTGAAGVRGSYVTRSRAGGGNADSYRKSEIGGSLTCQPYIPHARRKAEKLKLASISPLSSEREAGGTVDF